MSRISARTPVRVFVLIGSCSCTATSVTSDPAPPDAETAPTPDAAREGGRTVAEHDAAPVAPGIVPDAMSAAATMILENFDQREIPRNKGGDTYPSFYSGGARISVDTTDRAPQTTGSCLLLEVANPGPGAQIQFNPYDENGREYARTYAACGHPAACGSPASWRTNTYTKLRFWLKVPADALAPEYSAGGNYDVGTYGKSFTKGESGSDEQPGGGHFYYSLWLAPTGTWWQIVLNMHPDHERGDPGSKNFGFHPYLTAERGADPANTYNFFDTFTRWYFDVPAVGNRTPSYKLDDIAFTTATGPEDELHIGAIAGTFVPREHRVIVNWARVQGEDDKWDVRYAFEDLHALGWSKAMTAPGSPVTPPGAGTDYIGVHYETTAVATGGQSVIFVGVRSQRAQGNPGGLFNQIAIPLQ